MANDVIVLGILLALLGRSIAWDDVSPWYSDSTCICNGYSDRCYFNKELYQKTGQGAHCLDCTSNREGPNCEKCRDNFFLGEGGQCIPCNCNNIGSLSLQCDIKGKCICKFGITGPKCNHCDINYYGLSANGCKPCICNDNGTIEHQSKCDHKNGSCFCKKNVEGKLCDRCKPGYFNLDKNNTFGCIPCFCNGKTMNCKSAMGYVREYIKSDFKTDNDQWNTQELNENSLKSTISIRNYERIGTQSTGSSGTYFIAPDRFLGDQKASYDQHLMFNLWSNMNDINTSKADIIITGSGFSISQSFDGQRNSVPTTEASEYRFRLNEDVAFGWEPPLTAHEFYILLSNISGIYIRRNHNKGGTSFLNSVLLESANIGFVGEPATWIENCNCPGNYIGQFCEFCSAGHYRAKMKDELFSKCKPCNCNGHSSNCDSETGQCICQHNTTGPNCDSCLKGFYGNALLGTENDCKLCPCPFQLSCREENLKIVCLNCPEGHEGPLCGTCKDGYYGDPLGQFGSFNYCKMCNCSNHKNTNISNLCDKITGKCISCKNSKNEWNCSECLPGYYTNLEEGICTKCNCSTKGSISLNLTNPLCDMNTGKCQCKPHVNGVSCDDCEDGFYNINSDQGCTSCNCDPLGSLSPNCNKTTGQCDCQTGMSGRICDICEHQTFDINYDQCFKSKCLPQCNTTGKCQCSVGQNINSNLILQENVMCPTCFKLVKDSFTELSENVRSIQENLNNIEQVPTVDENFERKMFQIEDGITDLWNGVTNSAESGRYSEILHSLINHIEGILNLTNQSISIRHKAEDSIVNFHNNLSQIAKMINNTSDSIQNFVEYIHAVGHTTFEEAIRVSNTFRDYNNDIAAIAKESIGQSIEQQKASEKIFNYAEKSINITLEVNELSEYVIKSQYDLSIDIHRIQMHMELEAQKLLMTKNSLAELIPKIFHASVTISEIQENITLFELPDINYNKMMEKSAILATEALTVLSQTKSLVLDNSKFLNDLLSTEEAVKASMNKSAIAQNMTDRMMGELLASMKNISEIQEQISELLRTTEMMHNHLKEFLKRRDMIVKELEIKLPQINNLIKTAENKSQSAEKEVRDAEYSSGNGLYSVMETQKNIVNDTTKVIEKNRQESNNAKLEAMRLYDETHALAGRVSVTSSGLEETEDNIKLDGENIANVKKSLEIIKLSSDETSNLIGRTLYEIDAVMTDLSKLTDIDISSLYSLETRLIVAESELINADLDSHIDKMKKAKFEQDEKIKAYQEEVVFLKNEVDRLLMTQRAITEGCWKRLKLEP